MALLEHKIGALDQAAPLAGCELPDAFPTLRRLLDARMAKVSERGIGPGHSACASNSDLEVLHGAVKDAICAWVRSATTPSNTLCCAVSSDALPKLDLDIDPYLHRANVAIAAASQLYELVGWRHVLTDTPQVLLSPSTIKTLKLPTFLREGRPMMARQCATEFLPTMSGILSV